MIADQSAALARTRLQQKGDLYQQGGWWKLRWREDKRYIDEHGQEAIKYTWSAPVYIGPCVGAGAFTKTEARRIAWDNFLSRLDQNMRAPMSIMTVREFVERCFIPEHVIFKLKPSGRSYYENMLPHVLDGVPERRRSFKGHKKGAELPAIPRRFGIGSMRLRDVRREDVQRLVSEAIQRGYSVQTARHILTCVSAVFTHAEKKDWFSGSNPARFVELPEMLPRRPVHALSFEQLQRLLFSLQPKARAMVLCASLTSMNIAEICGLRWRRVNLSDEWVIVDGESIPPKHIAVREQWYRRAFGSVKAKARRRNLPMASLLREALSELRAEKLSIGEDDIVFEGRERDGKPLSAGAMLNHQVRPAAHTAGLPAIGWHDLRRSFATLADQLGMSIGERKALMGQARAEMTLRYTHTASKEAIEALEEIAERIRPRSTPSDKIN